jgi:predicted transposase YdaD
MAKKKSKKKPQKEKELYEGNQFDKIFKENAESIFIPLVEQRLGIKIKTFTPLKEKLQTTLEREMDFFYEIEPEEGEKFLLHLEFQTDDDLEMVYRSGEYHGIALRQKKMEIKHIVIYLGTGTPQMTTKLPEKEVYRGFELINVHGFNFDDFLQSPVPDVILLAILSNYPKEQSESKLRLILKQLKAVCKNPSQLSKYLKQLIVLSRLRKIEDLTIKISEEMPITYDIKTDYLYLRGIEQGLEQGLEQGIEQGLEQGIEQGLEQGIEQGIEQGTSQKDYENKFNFVKSLLENTDFNDEKIAILVGVSINFITDVKDVLYKNEDKSNLLDSQE